MENLNSKIWLSPSKLNLFQECPLCFWLSEVKGVHRPQGPFSSLPNGLDRLIKEYFDQYRVLGKVPPELEGKVEGKPFSDQALMDKWRNWKTGLSYTDDTLNAVLFGALDECFVNGDYYIPVDYKTRGFDLKEDSTSYYQTQLDCYAFLLEKSGYPTPSFGYLIYYIPKKVEENGLIKFRIEPQKMETNPQRAYEVFAKALQLIANPAPASHSGCQFCSWGNDFPDFE